MQLTDREKSLVIGFREIEKFNHIAGAQPSVKTLWNKTLIALEEVEETLDAFGAWQNATHCGFDVNNKELIDGGVDSVYTILALVKEFESLGYDFFGAFKTVCENNTTKFVKTATEAEMSVRQYQSQGVECKSVYNEKYDCYSIVDSNNKVRKPLGYKSVELEQFLPKEN